MITIIIYTAVYNIGNQAGDVPDWHQPATTVSGQLYNNIGWALAGCARPMYLCTCGTVLYILYSYRVSKKEKYFHSKFLYFVFCLPVRTGIVIYPLYF